MNENIPENAWDCLDGSLMKQNETSTIIKKITELVEPYAENDQYVYKCCVDDWIAVLKKTERTITNETRTSIVNPKYAKYRGNCFEVVLIFDSHNPLNQRPIAHSTYDTLFSYRVGDIIEIDDFDTNVENVCSSGIHYFKDVKAAFFYTRPFEIKPKPVRLNFTGIWNRYLADGSLVESSSYRDGKLNGKMIQWDGDQMQSQKDYVGGEIHGDWIQYYRNGKISVKQRYYCGYLDGVSEKYYSNGQLESVETYVRGILCGESNRWYKNGQIEYKCNYTNDGRDGIETRWHDNGKMKQQCHYTDNEKNGIWIEWTTDGTMIYQCNYIEDEKYGVEVSWHDNGQIKYCCPFTDGEKNGIEIEWDSVGRKLYQHTYTNGKQRFDEMQFLKYTVMALSVLLGFYYAV